MAARAGVFAWLFGRSAPAERVEPRLARRSFDMGRPSRLASEWTLQNRDPNAALAGSLSVVRARSRDLARNSDHARGFLVKVRSNVIGQHGIRLRVDARRPDGTRDVADSELVQREWTKWGKLGVPTMCGRLSLRELQALAIRSVIRDGEFLAIKVYGARVNRWGFALQVLDPELLDASYSARLASGNRVIMGVEVDRYMRAVAFHILTDRPDALVPALDRKRVRVPADQVIHAFVPLDADDVRGMPWFNPTGARLYQVGKYEQAELVASRIAASKMGFYQTEGGEFGTPDDEGAGADADGDGRAGDYLEEVEPGYFGVLPAGAKFQPFDPQHPTTQFGDFLKHQLRSASVGLGLSYVAFANDLDGVSYSSMRQAALEDRSLWQDLQGWMAEFVLAPIYTAWLEGALLSGALGSIPPGRIDKFASPIWQARGWAWVDPQKEIAAREREVALGVTSRRRIATETGRDFDDVQGELAAEEGAPRVYSAPAANGSATQAPAAAPQSEDGNA
jgi:lambda family phage portal protein